MITLTRTTRLLIKALFPASEINAVEKLLTEKCGDNLPSIENSTAAGMERVRYAALKVSRGDYVSLVKAVEQAQTDWHELLVSADFANDPKIHENWCDEFLLEMKSP
jgi:hypothetical protein